MKRKTITGALLAVFGGVAITHTQAAAAVSDGVMGVLEGKIPLKPEKPEVKKPEPAQPEAKKPEPAQPEAKKPEVKKPEPAQPEAKKPEVKKPEPAQPEAKKPEVKKPEPAQPEAKKPEVKKPEPAQPEATKPETWHFDRVLSKPGVSLYAAPQEDKKSTSYLPNYSILHVLEHSNGWVKVTANTKNSGAETAAWLKEADAIPWKHQLVAQFEKPGKRKPVLFFDSKEAALQLYSLPTPERHAELEKIYEALQKGEECPNPHVIATEPEGWAEMQNNFYLLPITDFEVDDSEVGSAHDVKAIQISAATENTENVANLADARGMKLDLVFVIDLSRSMNPVKDRVLETIRQIAEAVKSNPRFKDDMVHFGLWGYRDNTELCKGIEYVTKDYTADGLLAAGDFVSVLQNATATEVDSVDYEEDVLAGVKDAVLKTKWREDAARTIFLIGDAPGRERGKTDPFSKRNDKPVGTAADMDIPQIVALAQENRVEIGTLYLNVERHKQYLPLGRKQFELLATKTLEQATKVVNVKDQDRSEFDTFAQEVISTLVAQVYAGSNGGTEITPGTEGQRFATSLFHNAKVRWLARHHKIGVTPEMTGWISDKDLTDPGLDAVKPCVLLTRTQLEQLSNLLANVIQAGKKATGSGSDFFEELQCIVTTSTTDASQLGNVRTLADVAPDFLKELPYISSVMSMTDDVWQSMTAAERDLVIKEVESKQKYYAETYENVDAWMTTDENNDKGSQVVALPLDQLP